MKREKKVHRGSIEKVPARLFPHRMSFRVVSFLFKLASFFPLCSGLKSEQVLELLPDFFFFCWKSFFREQEVSSNVVLLGTTQQVQIKITLCFHVILTLLSFHYWSAFHFIHNVKIAAKSFQGNSSKSTRGKNLCQLT